MKKILVATTNPGKYQEIKKGLQLFFGNKIQLLTLNDVRVENKPAETGKTFKQNALIKAKFYAQLTGCPTIADDGGLTIPALDNQPGVLSRRWPGYEASDEELINFCLANLRGFTGADRTAYLNVVLCFFDPTMDSPIFSSAKIKGKITDSPSPRRIKGYPFRALFIIDKFNKYYDELTEKEHQQINHRLKAVKKLSKKIKNLLSFN